VHIYCKRRRMLRDRFLNQISNLITWHDRRSHFGCVIGRHVNSCFLKRFNANEYQFDYYFVFFCIANVQQSASDRWGLDVSVLVGDLFYLNMMILKTTVMTALGKIIFAKQYENKYISKGIKYTFSIAFFLRFLMQTNETRWFRILDK